jgi:hypothetical protein
MVKLILPPRNDLRGAIILGLERIIKIQNQVHLGEENL